MGRNVLIRAQDDRVIHRAKRPDLDIRGQGKGDMPVLSGASRAPDSCPYVDFRVGGGGPPFGVPPSPARTPPSRRTSHALYNMTPRHSPSPSPTSRLAPMHPVRRPLPAGNVLVTTLCSYEVAMMLTRSSQRTITAHVRRRPILGILILAALAHHWYVEAY